MNSVTAALLCFMYLTFQVIAVSLVNKEEAVNYRLDGTVKPNSYTIQITPSITSDNDFDSFQGVVKIKGIVKNKSSKFNIHVGQDIVIDGRVKITKNEELTTVTAEKDVYYETTDEYEGNDLYNINTDLNENDTVEIEIQYSSIFPSGMFGFYKSKYKDDNETERIILATQFEPTYARKAFPCFDEPSYKATFTVTLVVPEGYFALSNSDLVDYYVADKKITINFYPTPRMPTYTLAFVIYDVESLRKVENETEKFITWGTISDVANNKTELSQNYGPKFRDAMGEYLGISYWLNELDEDGTALIENKPTKIEQIAIPDFSVGAMENWGLITYRETALLFKEGEHSETARKRVITVISHEMAHQWFGNLVTAEWWGWFWLNEAFANYFEYYLTDVVMKEHNWRMEERYIVDEQMKVLLIDAYEYAPPLTKQDVDSATSASTHMGTITYSKGGSVVRMFKDIIGPENFQDNLKSYMKKYAGKATNPDNLFDELIKGVNSTHTGLTPDADLKGVLRRWTEENGFPLVLVSRNENDSTSIVITQTRFLMDEGSDKKYDIKLTVTSDQNGFGGTHWLMHDDDSIDLPGLDINNWVLVKTTGFFRVNYDTEIWQALIYQMQTQSVSGVDDSAIQPLERAVLLDNALNLARAGYIKYDLAIDVLSYLEHELDFIPWYAVSTSLDFLHHMLVKSNKDTDNTINNYILEIIENVFNELEKREPKTHIEKIHYSNIFNWACRAGHEKCLEKVKNDFPKYMEGSDSSLNVDITNTVYCYAVKSNGDAWGRLWLKLSQERDAIIQSVQISALGCSSSKTILDLYLESAILDNVIREQDIASVFASVSSNPDGTDVALTFLENRIEEVVNKTKTLAHGMRNIINGIAQYLTTTEEMDRLKAIASKEDIEQSVQIIINDAIGTVEKNVQWKMTFEEEVLNALKEKLPATVTPVDRTSTLGASGINPSFLLFFYPFLYIVNRLVF